MRQMQSTTSQAPAVSDQSTDPAVLAALPMERRVTVAAGVIGIMLNLPPSIALRTLAGVYQRAALHAYGPGPARAALMSHRIQSAMCARRLAVEIEDAGRPEGRGPAVRGAMTP